MHQKTMLQTLILSLVAVLGGACIALQLPINARLGQGLGFPIAAAMMSFISGMVLLTSLTLIATKLGGTSLNWGQVSLPFYVLGGLLGAIYVTITIVLIPHIGTTATFGLSIVGQLLGGMVLDRIGFVGFTVRELNLGRVSGVMLLILGAILIQKY